MKKSILFLLVGVISLLLSACSSSNQQVIIATGGTSGTYYPIGGGIAQIISDNTDATATAQSTGASVENMRLLKSGDVDIAFAQTDIADYASKGELMFENDSVDNLQGLGTLYNETIQIVLPANSEINSISELKGKKVSVGAPGSGVEANAKQILEIYGLTFEDLKAEYLSFGDSAQKIQDGNLDAAFLTSGAPTSAVTELSATKGVKLLSIEEEKAKELIEKYPYYVQETIPADTYNGVSEIDTVAVKAMLVVREELSEDLVYSITKAIFSNTDTLGSINAKAKSITAENAVEGLNLEIHPGALKYYQENGLK